MPKTQVLPVFFDLEMSGLNADYARILCACVKPYNMPAEVYRFDETKVAKKEPWNDREVAVWIRDALEGTYQIYGYNSVQFDLKFLNSRLLKHRERPLKQPLHKDLLYVAKNTFCLSSNRLATVQEFLGLETEKTRIDGEHWNRATAGHKPSMDYIVEHCQRDVGVLEELFEMLVPFIGVIYR